MLCFVCTIAQCISKKPARPWAVAEIKSATRCWVVGSRLANEICVGHRVLSGPHPQVKHAKDPTHGVVLARVELDE